MRLFVVSRGRDKGFKRVEAFEAGETLEASVAKELADLEGFEAEIFIGADLVDVAKTSPSWFGEAAGSRRTAA